MRAYLILRSLSFLSRKFGIRSQVAGGFDEIILKAEINNLTLTLNNIHIVLIISMRVKYSKIVPLFILHTTVHYFGWSTYYLYLRGMVKLWRLSRVEQIL